MTGVSAAWGLNAANSTDIIVFGDFTFHILSWSLSHLVPGAGHYSFFQNYAKGCEDTVSCQAQIVNVDSTSSVHIYSLSTVGTTSMLSVNSKGVIAQSNNANGFAETVTSWSQS